MANVHPAIFHSTETILLQPAVIVPFSSGILDLVKAIKKVLKIQYCLKTKKWAINLKANGLRVMKKNHINSLTIKKINYK